MACNYANGLSPYENKGKLGLKEIFDSNESVADKVKKLAELISSSKYVVVHTGAGISTAAGIPDFRGPNGVWTLEAQGKKPDESMSFDSAIPTKTHMALLKLIAAGKIQYIISQNIDGLHLRSGLPRKYLAELHGNMFIEQCSYCKRQFVRNSATTSVGQKCLGTNCPASKLNGRVCRGKMHDIILDWEHNLPEKDLEMADYHSSLADLSLCLGTTLQIIPSGNLPLKTKKYRNGKVVICNLQPTKHDKKADLIINGYVDDIMTLLLEYFDLKYEEYNPKCDPVSNGDFMEWTIPNSEISDVKKMYTEMCNESKRKGNTKNIDLEFPKKRKREEIVIKKEIKSEGQCHVKDAVIVT